MSEKQLSPGEWNKFSASRNIQNADMPKALLTLEKAEQARDPAQELKALADIRTQTTTLRNSAKGDKAVLAYLAAMDKALAIQRKTAETRQAEPAPLPELLTKKLKSNLQQVRRGTSLPALIAWIGHDMLVVVSKKAREHDTRESMRDCLPKGGVHFSPGDCVFEKNCFTFVLGKLEAGMARNVKKALKRQLKQQLGVRVRSADSNEIDEDIDESQDGELSAEDNEPADAADTAAAPDDSPESRYQQRLVRLVPRIAAMLRAHPAAGPNIRTVTDFARDKAAEENYRSALAALDAVEKMLTVPDTPADAGDSTGEPSLADLAQARTAWRQERLLAVGEIHRLQAALRQTFRDMPDQQAALDTAIARLENCAQGLGSGFEDTLERLLQAPTTAARAPQAALARASLRQLQQWIVGDPLMQELDGNEILPDQTVAAPLLARLSDIARSLG